LSPIFVCNLTYNRNQIKFSSLVFEISSILFQFFSYMIVSMYSKTIRAHWHHTRQSCVNSRLFIDLSAFIFSKTNDHIYHYRCNTRSFYFIAAVVASSSYIFDQLFKNVEYRGKCLLGMHDYPPESYRSCVWPITCAPDRHVSGYRLRKYFIVVEIVTHVTSDHFHSLTRQPVACKLS